MNDTARPHRTRREHQQALDRRRRRVRKTRMARVRRVRAFRALRTAQFWTRTATGAVVILCLAFWAKFAVVYDVPAFEQFGPLSHVSSYVTVKPWWFGPPVFDLQQYSQPENDGGIVLIDPNTMLFTQLGRYRDVVLRPQIVWAQRTVTH